MITKSRHAKALATLTGASVGLMMMTSGCAVKNRLFPEKPALLSNRTIVPPPSFRPPVDTMSERSDFNSTRGTLPSLEPMLVPLDDIFGAADDAGLPAKVGSSTLSYKVQKNDSLWKVAHMYGVSVEELASFNSLDPKALLQVGKDLRIPPGGKLIPESERQGVKEPATKVQPATGSAKASDKPSAAAPAAGTTSSKIERRPVPADGKYTVESGDSLWVIARRFGVEMDKLRKLNNLDSDVLQIGRVLILTDSAATTGGTPAVKPAPATGTVQPPATGTGMAEPAAPGVPAIELPKTLKHTASPNETLESVAEMYETSVDAIKQANPNIKDNKDLRPGMELIIPYD